MKHTPGPWKVKELSKRDIAVTSDTYYAPIPHICKLYCIKNQEEMEANASLIAAAPDLLEACKDQLALICRLCILLNPQHADIKNCTCGDTESFRNAIAKAEGKL
jgi:hypothetical protein